MINTIKNVFSLRFNSKKRIFGLDLLRFLAIMFVLVGHGRHLLKPIIENTGIFLFLGSLGVEFFFVLSGFLIGTILIKIYLKEKKMNISLLINFWIRRRFRTIPNYYLILIINVLLAILILGNADGFSRKYIFFIQNFNTPHPSFFGEARSLAVEEFFYLTLPVLLLLIHSLFKGILNAKNILLLSIITYLIVSTGIRIQFTELITDDWNENIRKITSIRLDSIIYGVIGSYISFFYNELFKKYTYLLLFIGIVGIIFYINTFYTELNQDILSMFNKSLLLSTLSFSILLTMPFFSQLNIKDNETYTNLIKKGITHISIISYSIYLTHYSIVLKFQRGFNLIPETIIESILFFTLYITVTIIISTLIYNYFESPMTNIRERF